jgi:hypothetical protein
LDAEVSEEVEVGDLTIDTLIDRTAETRVRFWTNDARIAQRGGGYFWIRPPVYPRRYFVRMVGIPTVSERIDAFAHAVSSTRYQCEAILWCPCKGHARQLDDPPCARLAEKQVEQISQLKEASEFLKVFEDWLQERGWKAKRNTPVHFVYELKNARVEWFLSDPPKFQIRTKDVLEHHAQIFNTLVLNEGTPALWNLMVELCTDPSKLKVETWFDKRKINFDTKAFATGPTREAVQRALQGQLQPAIERASHSRALEARNDPNPRRFESGVDRRNVPEINPCPNCLAPVTVQPRSERTACPQCGFDGREAQPHPYRR